MRIDIILTIIAVTAIILTMLFVFIFCIYKFIILKYRENNIKLSTNLTIDELMDAISIVVTNEISLYERNVLDNKGKILTNATYDNYYKDIMQNISDALSPEIIERLGFYITRPSLYRMISREVQTYLNGKIM